MHVSPEGEVAGLRGDPGDEDGGLVVLVEVVEMEMRGLEREREEEEEK